MISPFPHEDTRYITIIEDKSNNDGDSVQFTQFLSTYFFMVMFLRVYFAIKAYYNFSHYKNHFSMSICRKYQIHPNNWFILKFHLTNSPVLTISLIFAYSVIMFASFVLMFEVEYFLTTSLTSLNDPFFASIYFIIITMTTIGYGDYSP